MQTTVHIPLAEPAARRQPPPPLPRWVMAPAVAVLCGAWGAAVWASEHVAPDPVLRDAALFVHLAALVAGFGAVLVIDWVGVLWLLERRTFTDVTRTAEAVHLVVWVCLAALTASGALLSPDTGALLTRIKLALVLVIALNGLHAHALQPRLAACQGRPPGGLLARSAVTALVSQACWWTAMAIGYYNHQA